MAAPIALLKFSQGALIGNDGEALAVAAGSPVAIENSNNANVQSWRINLVYTPPGSSVPIAIPLAQNPASNTPYALVTPDVVAGCYRVQIFVYGGVSYSGDQDQDIRNIVVPHATGIVFPPYQMLPSKLPVLGSGIANEKPDELNLGGQPYGWDGEGTEGLLLHFMREVVAGRLGGSGFSWKYIPVGESVTVPVNRQMVVSGGITVDGELNLDGELALI